MNQQLNSPREMARRLAFLAYAACCVVFFVEMVATIARPGWRDLSVAAGAFALMVLMRQIGYRRLDFKRLVESFPDGCALDRVPEEVRTEVEGLVDEFYAPGTGWVRRTEIRHRLVELEEIQPEIAEAYSDDLHQVLAA